MGCDVLVKGTQVDGVYSADPKTQNDATRYKRLSYNQVLAHGLKVMDASAISLAQENQIPILIFSIHRPGAFASVVGGVGEYSLIDDQE